MYDFVAGKETQVTQSAGNDEAPVFSPDGKSIAYVRDGRELHVTSPDGTADRVLASGELREPALVWSTDGEWIAFSNTGAKSFLRTVSLVAVSGGAARPASFLANGDTAGAIAWSPDGRFLLFDTAQRSEPSRIARVYLAPHAPRFREDEFQDLFQTKPSAIVSGGAGEGKSAGAGAKTAKPAPVKVDFDGIRERLTPLPLGLNADGPVIGPDGKTLLVAARAAGQVNLFTYSLDEMAREPPTARQLTSTAGMKRDYAFTPDSKRAAGAALGEEMKKRLEWRRPGVQFSRRWAPKSKSWVLRGKAL